jgi:hypothetical protein
MPRYNYDIDDRIDALREIAKEWHKMHNRAERQEMKLYESLPPDSSDGYAIVTTMNECLDVYRQAMYLLSDVVRKLQQFEDDTCAECGMADHEFVAPRQCAGCFTRDEQGNVVALDTLSEV